jgi:hypothetical protein
VYLGHVGIALGAKGFRPRVALLALLIATYAPDWVDSGLCILGAYDPGGMSSHSLPVVVVLAALGLVAYAPTTGDWLGGLVIAAVIASHMVLDWLTGYKPTWPGGPMIGMRLYDRPVLSLGIETIVLIVGVLLYRRSLPKRTRGWIDPAIMFGVLMFMELSIAFLRSMTVSLPKC